MEKRRIPLGLIVLCLIVIVVGSLWGAHLTGIIDVKTYLAQVPYVNKIFLEEDKAANVINIPIISPVEKENQQLQKEKQDLQEHIKELENSIVALESEKTSLMEQIESQQLTIGDLEDYKLKKEQETVNLKELSLYYRDMKPDAIVNVLKNLDDDTVVKLLPLLEQDQVSKILALMQPERAALITQMILQKGT